MGRCSKPRPKPARRSASTRARPIRPWRRCFAILSGVNWHQALAFAEEVVGADNIMFAIDYPNERAEPAVSFIRAAPLPPDKLERIAHRNAERIFGIKAAA